MHKRFISIIEDPGQIWSRHCVIDTNRGIEMCKCSQEKDADFIALILNQRTSQQSTDFLLLQETTNEE